MIVQCASLISRRNDCFCSRGVRFCLSGAMFSEVNVKFDCSFHALCIRHVDPPEVWHLAESSPMHGGNVTLVVTTGF